MYCILNARTTRGQSRYIVSTISRWATNQHKIPPPPSLTSILPTTTRTLSTTSCHQMFGLQNRQILQNARWTHRNLPITNTTTILMSPNLEILYLGQRGKHKEGWGHKGGYANFGHKPVPESKFTLRLFNLIFVAFVLCFLDWD